MKKIKNKKWLTIVGARPNFIKAAPLLAEIKKYREIKPVLVHTGQHYDFLMSQVFFQELKIPKPDYNLGVGSASHATQTAKIMLALEPVLIKEKPDLVIVIGDVNSTLAGALTAAKRQIPVAHIEAGLRSFDMTMPEEINRRLTDHLAQFLFVSESIGISNLKRENIKNNIYLVGDLLADAVKEFKIKNLKSKILNKYGLKKRTYALVTLHRPNNVDVANKLSQILAILQKIQKKIPLVFPAHPRTKKQLPFLKNILTLPPLGYLDFLDLMSGAKFVLTDSGGIQLETSLLNVPCLTLRETTERPVTIYRGTNTLCGTNAKLIAKNVRRILSGKNKQSSLPRLLRDGKTSQRLIKILIKAEIPSLARAFSNHTIKHG